MKNLGEKGIDCIFIGYAEHSKCYRFYVIEPNDYVSVNSIIESRDAIFDEERFTSIPRPRGMIQPSSSKIAEDEVEGTDDVPGPSVPRKSNRTRKAKSFGSDFQLYLVEGTRDKTLSQPTHCYHSAAYQNLGVLQMKQPEGFVILGHESMVCKLKKSLFDASGKGVIICLYVDDMLIFGTDQDQVNKTKEFLSSNFDIKDLGEAELEYSRAIGCLMYAMISTRQDITFPVGKLRTMDYGLTYSGYPSIIEGYSDASWINNMQDHSSKSGWVFLLVGGAISWASKKQTYITSSTMESEFVALAAAGNEAE
ncbi:zinc finger, CCHC-type containing protein [Tanacetum coccineum]